MKKDWHLDLIHSQALTNVPFCYCDTPLSDSPLSLIVCREKLHLVGRAKQKRPLGHNE